MTPRYLASVECRRELLTFAARARHFGAVELVLPVKYAVLPAGEPDDVRQVIEEHQWEDWTALRLEDEASSVHRRAVARLAARLHSAATDLETRPVPLAGPEDERDDDAEGLIERFAAITAAGERLSTLGAELTEAMDEISDALSEFGPALRAGGGSSAIAAAHRLAQRIEEPTVVMEGRVVDAAGAFREMDGALCSLIELAQFSPEVRSQLLELRPRLREFDRQFGAMDDGADTARMIHMFGNISRELRRPFRRLADALRILGDMRDLANRWDAALHALASS